VTDCTIGYFKSLSRKACVKCPSSCLVCFAELNCTSCQPGLFLHDGSCIESCPSFPIRYYANVLSSKCVKDCPTPYFGFNGTGKCELTCPEKYFSDITDNSCKLCNVGCRQCTTKLNCTSCLAGYVYVSQYNTCSKVCNITHVYYVENKCQFSCIDGTFLLSDLVTCQKCSTACATCSMSGTNCTKCNNKFWYNFNCVTECPKGFYADSNNSCIDCKINQAACSVETLRYNVETFTKDYKVFAFVKFNRPISLGKSVANRLVNSASRTVNSVSKTVNSLYQSDKSTVSRSVGASEDYRAVGEGDGTS
jgi:proprotein convertase subtilisin/kexin type 5